MGGRLVFALGTSVLLAAAFAPSCKPRASGKSAEMHAVASPAPHADALQRLRAFETARRAATDFGNLPTSDTALGSDPYALRRLPASLGLRSARFVGVLRGSSAVVVLDDSLHELARLDAPRSASSIAISGQGDIFVAGDLSHTIRRYRFEGDALRPRGTLDLPDVMAIRGLASGPEGVLYVIEEHDGRLLTLSFDAGKGAVRGAADGPDAPLAFHRVDTPVGHGALRVARVGRHLIVDCLLDHALVVLPVDAAGVPVAQRSTRIVHDGPLWGFDALELPAGDPADAGLLVAAGGVEDHPLDRTEGSFGFIDSFLYLYRVDRGAAERLSAVDTSAFGLVTPKAIHLSRGALGSVEVTVVAYGSSRGARIEWAKDASDREAEPNVATFDAPPGSAAIEPYGDGSFAIADPLLDAWVRLTPSGGAPGVVHVDDAAASRRGVDSRMGEALFFTTWMAPWDKSDGRLSRFTCETCHFEGYADGRTHRTGRGDIVATTKPLLGLFNNKPHFSRALDPDLTAVADNEFRVAGAKSDHDPWFSLSRNDFLWIAEVAPGAAEWSPEHLRRALMTFLMDFNHRPNPAVLGRSSWSSDERAGAEVFRDRCESCHAARLVADDPSTRVPFDAWESKVMSPQGALVWARAEYEKTGVEPYVHERGARVVSLRRLFKKYPYFTNGTAKSLEAVLDRARYGDALFFHDHAPDRPDLRPLTAREKGALLEFLNLL